MECRGKDACGNIIWQCRCDCGVEKVIRGYHLRNGHSRSCGCLQKEITRRRATHGHCKNRTETAEYRAWCSMRDRCYRPTQSSFKNYGARGIKVCDRWSSYEHFFADMGSKPSPKYSLDRINNDGDYEPSNCRWATRSVQSANQRPRANKSSKYVGVSIDAESGLWKAQVRISLGRFATEDAARIAIDELFTSRRSGKPFHWHESE